MAERDYSRAAVVGGSIAGLVAARVLADHFDQVVVFERDDLDDPLRKGAPQARHVHVLLRRGVELLEAWFPGIHREMVASGVRPFDFARDMRWFQKGSWLPRIESQVITYPQSRACLEAHIRRRLAGLPNVELRCGQAVSGLLASPDAGRIVGLTVNGETVRADLVVDAAGRGTAVYRWLDALGFAPIEQTSLRIDLRYVSRLYQPPRRARDWRAMWYSPSAPQSPYACALQMIEGDRWLLSLAGYHGDAPSSDPDKFLDFAAKLPTADLAQAMVGAIPLSEPHVFRCSTQRWMHIERARQFPAALLVVGDAYCSFDPVFGQGMTIAMVTCDWMQTHLRRLQTTAGLTQAWTAACYRDCAAWLRGMWSFVTGEALRHPQTPGELTPLARSSQWLSDELYALAKRDPEFHKRLLHLTHMTAGPQALLRPTTALQLALRAAQSQPPQASSRPVTQVRPLRS